MRALSDPLVLALEKDRKAKKEKLKRCCSACSISQRYTRKDKVYQTVTQEQDLDDFLRPPPGEQEEDEDSEETSASVAPAHPPSSSLISSWTKKQVFQASLWEAVGPDGDGIIVKLPFSTSDLEAWEKVAKNYQSDPIATAKCLKYIIKQHNPDWSDMQLLLDALTETEKQLILETARDFAEDYYRTQQLDVKDYFPLQKTKWNPNIRAEREKLESYQEWIAKEVERAIPKTINW